MEAWCIGSVCSGATRAAERGGMCCPHYVDRPLPQPGNWLPGSAPVSQGFTSPISNNYFVRVCNSSRERWRVLRFIISSRVVHSSCCYASCFFFLFLLLYWQETLGSNSEKLSGDWARPLFWSCSSSSSSSSSSCCCSFLCSPPACSLCLGGDYFGVRKLFNNYMRPGKIA